MARNRKPRRTSPVPIKVDVGDQIYHRGSDRYLGKVTEVKRITVRYDRPGHGGTNGLATRYEIYLGDPPA